MRVFFSFLHKSIIILSWICGEDERKDNLLLVITSWRSNYFCYLFSEDRQDNLGHFQTSSRMNGEGVTGGELVREEVSLRREMQRRPEHSFHFSIASLLFSSHRDWACCLLPSVSQPSPDHLLPSSSSPRAKGKEKRRRVPTASDPEKRKRRKGAQGLIVRPLASS